MKLLERIFGRNGPEVSYKPQPEPIRDEADLIWFLMDKSMELKQKGYSDREIG